VVLYISEQSRKSLLYNLQPFEYEKMLIIFVITEDTILGFQMNANVFTAGLIIVSFVFCGLVSSAQTIQKPLINSSCQLMKAAATYNLTKKKYNNSYSSGFRSDTIDILNYEISLNITDLSNQRIYGNCRVDFTPKISGISSISLDLLSLTIDSITSDGISCFFTYNDTLISISLPTNLNDEDTSEVTIYYNGNPEKDLSGWGGFYFQSGYAFNLGVGFEANPHNYGRIWFPCFDNFIERSTYKFNITTANGKKAKCNGTLISETPLNGDTIISTWILDREIPTYLACVAINDYETINQTHNGINGIIPIELYARSQDTSNLISSFSNLGAAISTFENSYGEYRWNKVGYSLVPFSSGAMEHATNIAFPRLAANGSLSYQDLMAHELAHHWWGNLATCDNEGDMWLNEGLATYSEFLFNETIYNAEAYRALVKSNHEEVMHMTHINDSGYRALYGIPHAYTYSDHVYLKGADVAHTLRGYMKDSLFFGGLTSFLDAHKFSSMNSYLLRDHLTQYSGMDLSDFFDKWVLKPGFPHFSIDSVKVASNGPNYEASVFTKQKLKAATSYFDQVPLEITFFDNSWNSQTEKIVHSGVIAVATFILPFNPVYTAINYYNKISDAISSDVKTLSAPGNYDYVNSQSGHITLTVNSITDSALVRIEHNWASPDPIKIATVYKLCPNRYWKIDGILPPNYSITAKMFYDGRKSGSSYYDTELFDDINAHEDSLVVLYRRDAGSDWTEYPFYTKTIIAPNDKWGQIVLDSFILGEFAFALKGDPFINSTGFSSITHISCFGQCDGSAKVSASGGTGPYSYFWNDGANQTNSTATGLCAGTYTVIAIDAADDSVSLTVSIVEPDSLYGIISVVNESCNGCSDGSLTLSAIGGATPYTYLWDDSGAQTNFTATGLTGNNGYSVILTDANSCSFNETNLMVNLNKKRRGDVMGIKVQPNPATGQFFIDLSRIKLKKHCSIKVSDIQGQIIYEKQLQNFANKVIIESQKWKSGIYIITICHQNRLIYSDKIILAN